MLRLQLGGHFKNRPIRGYMLIDEQDQDLSLHRWSATGGYAYRKAGGEMVYAHRVILERMLGRKLGIDEVTDHINRNKSDNRRDNLRAVTHSENQKNRGPAETDAAEMTAP